MDEIFNLHASCNEGNTSLISLDFLMFNLHEERPKYMGIDLVSAESLDTEIET